MQALEINDLFEQESPTSRLYAKSEEISIPMKREWWIDEEGTAYIVNLALPVEDGWLPVTFGESPRPAVGFPAQRSAHAPSAANPLAESIDLDGGTIVGME